MQVMPAGQVPHPIAPPQPSPCMPHMKPCATQVLGVQAVVHAPAMHACPAAHEPQSMILPHPSVAAPHWTLACAHVRGVHVGAQVETPAPMMTKPALATYARSTAFVLGLNWMTL